MLPFRYVNFFLTKETTKLEELLAPDIMVDYRLESKEVCFERLRLSGIAAVRPLLETPFFQAEQLNLASLTLVEDECSFFIRAVEHKVRVVVNERGDKIRELYLRVIR